MDVKTVDAGLVRSRYRMTKQREAVLRAFNGGGHLSAETIYARVRSEMPGVSLGTVYRTLDILRAIGLIQAFSYGTSAALFEATLEKHHHLVCSSCRSLHNVQAEDVAQIAHAIARDNDFDDVDFALTIVGRCRECKDAAGTAGGS